MQIKIRDRICDFLDWLKNQIKESECPRIVSLDPAKEENEYNDDLSNIIDSYRKLSKEAKAELQSIFPGSSVKADLFTCLQKANIENFYSIVKTKVVNKQERDIEDLKKLLYLLYVFYCEGTGCKLIEPELGTDFDEDYCIEKFSNEINGKISIVHLFGILNPDGSVKYKAIVTL